MTGLVVAVLGADDARHTACHREMADHSASASGADAHANHDVAIRACQRRTPSKTFVCNRKAYSFVAGAMNSLGLYRSTRVVDRHHHHHDGAGVRRYNAAIDRWIACAYRCAFGHAVVVLGKDAFRSAWAGYQKIPRH